jgi:3',5'-cyclic AMP phosphodiesterase CpdA
VPVIAHVSDLHFGAHVEARAESLLVDVWERKPDLVVVSGDLTQRARQAEFSDARRFLDRLPSPVLIVPGNHDLPLINLPKRMVRPHQSYEQLVAQDLEPVVALPNLIALGLDTMPRWRWKAGSVSRRQIERARHALRSGPPDAWRLLVTHHPVLPAELSSLKGRKPLVAAGAQSDVSVLLSGHTHIPTVDVVPMDATGSRHRSLAVGAGTAISRRTRGWSNSYALIDLAGPMVTGATMTVDIRLPEGSAWSVARTERFAWGSDGVVVPP